MLRLLLHTQELALLFQVTEESGQLPNDAGISSVGRFLFEDETEVEDEFVTLVSFIIVDADGIADDAVLVGAYGYQAIAELAAGDNVVGDALIVEQRRLRCWRWWARDDRAFGDLVEYCGACHICQVMSV